MAKQEPIKIGNRVRKRGFLHEGRVNKIGELRFFIHVDWDDGPLMKERPEWCHPGELEIIQ